LNKHTAYSLSIVAKCFESLANWILNKI